MRCGNDCSGGNLVVNGALMEYPKLGHRHNLTLHCAEATIPQWAQDMGVVVSPYSGKVVIRCDDAIVQQLSGNCLLRCPVGTPDPKTGIVPPNTPPTIL